jgi:hypothetical protein
LIGCVSSRESGKEESIAAFDEVADELAEAEAKVADAATDPAAIRRWPNCPLTWRYAKQLE